MSKEDFATIYTEEIHKLILRTIDLIESWGTPHNSAQEGELEAILKNLVLSALSPSKGEVMNISYHFIGNRQFLQIAGHSIPVDSIIDIDYDAPNEGSTNCVCIKTNQENGEYYYNYLWADALRSFLDAPPIDEIQAQKKL